MHSLIKFSLIIPLLLGAAACSASPPVSNASRQDKALGEVALKSGDPEVALRLADASLARDPSDAAALTQRGLALTALGRLSEARDSLHKSLDIRPDDIRTLIALGRVQLPVDPAAAAASFQAALNRQPNDASALNNLGIARDLLGDHARAQSAYRKALQLTPDAPAITVNLALSLAMSGQGEAAIKLLQPLASAPDATRKMREDYAAVLAMSGDKVAAGHILATNMEASKVQPAVNELGSARMGSNSAAR